MDKVVGGDGDFLDVLLFCVVLFIGIVVEVCFIGVLQFIDEGELDIKVIVIFMDVMLQIIIFEDFIDFSIYYDGVCYIIEIWFLYYDGLGINIFEGWLDELKILVFIVYYEQ